VCKGLCTPEKKICSILLASAGNWCLERHTEGDRGEWVTRKGKEESVFTHPVYRHVLPDRGGSLERQSKLEIAFKNTGMEE